MSISAESTNEGDIFQQTSNSSTLSDDFDFVAQNGNELGDADTLGDQYEIEEEMKMELKEVKEELKQYKEKLKGMKQLAEELTQYKEELKLNIEELKQQQNQTEKIVSDQFLLMQNDQKALLDRIAALEQKQADQKGLSATIQLGINPLQPQGMNPLQPQGMNPLQPQGMNPQVAQPQQQLFHQHMTVMNNNDTQLIMRRFKEATQRGPDDVEAFYAELRKAPHLLHAFLKHTKKQNVSFPGALPVHQPAYAFKMCPEESMMPALFPNDASTHGADVPKSLKQIGELPHGDVICAVIIAQNGRHVFTGGKGTVKMWDIGERLGLVASSTAAGGTNGGRVGSSGSQPWSPVNTFTCLKDSYIRSCKLFPDASTLIVGGETRTICVWDLNSEKVKTTLDCEAEACYALAITPDCRLCFSCCSNGSVGIWDLQNELKIGQLDGHTDGVSCMDLSADGARLWTGGLDSSVRCWDIGERAELNKYILESQIFSLGCSPTNDWVAVGLENNNVEVLHMNNRQQQEKYVLYGHKNCVVSLKVAHSGKWFVSTGKDSVVNCWWSPYGYPLLESKESGSVLSCDISSDDRFLLTGSGDKKATLYELSF